MILISDLISDLKQINSFSYFIFLCFSRAVSVHAKLCLFIVHKYRLIFTNDSHRLTLFIRIQHRSHLDIPELLWLGLFSERKCFCTCAVTSGLLCFNRGVRSKLLRGWVGGHTWKDNLVPRLKWATCQSKLSLKGRTVTKSRLTVKHSPRFSVQRQSQRL